MPFVPDKPQTGTGRFVPDEQAAGAPPQFVGPLLDAIGGPMAIGGPSLGNYNKNLALGVLDVGQSMLRGMVNKPTLTLKGITGAVQGALDPNLTWQQGYQQAQNEGRQQIENGQTIVGSERLRTPQGRAVASGVGQAARLTRIPQVLDWMGGKVEQLAGPEARDVVGSAAELASLGLPRVFTPRAAAPLPAAGETSIGAAAASPMSAALATASPELKAAAARAAAKRRAQVNPQVLDLHLEAEQLPVPIRLTEGQATGDPILISTERNARAVNEDYSKLFNQQNAKLSENMQALREQAGPEVFSTNPVEHGDTLIAAYKAKDAAAEAEINAKYQALRDAAGGDWPIDAGVLLKSASEQLHKKLLFEHAPSAVMSQLERLAGKDRGKMTFEQFESMRTNLARIQRSVDGNEAAAAGVIRSAMEDLPTRAFSNRAAVLKPLADEARAAARARFKELEADPAYAAAVDGSVPPDSFVRKFIINAPRDSVAKMRENLAGNETATQTMGVAALDHLRTQARLDELGRGKFAQDSYNKALRSLSPKLKDLVSAPVEQNLQRIGNIARAIKEQPEGSFVNNSNTFVAQAGKAAATAAELATNAAAKGLPVGTFGRGYLGRRAARKQFQRSTQPGAGLSYRKPSGLMD